MFLKIKVKMFLSFFLSRRLVLMVHPHSLTHSLTHFLYLLFAIRLHFGCNNSKEKKICNFVLNECKQNNNKSSSLLVLSFMLMLFLPSHCKYTVYFSRYRTATATTTTTMTARAHLRKMHFPTTYTLHTYSIYYCCSDFSLFVCLFVKHFCTGF